MATIRDFSTIDLSCQVNPSSVPPDPPHPETNGPISRRPGYRPSRRRRRIGISPTVPPVRDRLIQLRLPFDEAEI